MRRIKLRCLHKARTSPLAFISGYEPKRWKIKIWGFPTYTKWLRQVAARQLIACIQITTTSLRRRVLVTPLSEEPAPRYSITSNLVCRRILLVITLVHSNRSSWPASIHACSITYSVLPLPLNGRIFTALRPTASKRTPL